MIETQNIECAAQRPLNRILPRAEGIPRVEIEKDRPGWTQFSSRLDTVLPSIARYVWISTVFVTLSLIWKIGLSTSLICGSTAYILHAIEDQYHEK